MPILLLLRDKPLSPAEIQRLPSGCFPVSDSSGRIVARTIIRGPIPMLLFMVAKMVKAVPDADFGYEEGFDEDSDSNFESDSRDWSSEESQSDAVVEESESLWRSELRKGQIDEAVELFLQEGCSLSLAHTQELLSSNQSHNIIFVCKIVSFLRLSHVVLKLKRNLQHPDADVKIAILNAYALLADSSIAPAIHRFLADANEEIRIAAVRAFQSIQEREPDSL